MPIKTQAKFGRALRTARLDCGLTITDVAEVMRINSGLVSYIESGNRKIPSEALEDICGYLERQFKYDANELRRLAQNAELESANRVEIGGLPINHRSAVVRLAGLKNFTPELDFALQELLGTVV